MIIQRYLEEMTKIQTSILDYLDSDTDSEIKFQYLQNIFDETNIYKDKHKLKSFFYLLLHISNNHHRKNNFNCKIVSILQLFKNEMKKNYSKLELFRFFISNKRILLFLLEEDLITFDKSMIELMRPYKYLSLYYAQYFTPEIRPLLQDSIEKVAAKDPYSLEARLLKEIPENFYTDRRKGENESYICQLIREDRIEEFIVYFTKNNYSVDDRIKASIYDTSSVLIKKKYRYSLVEYAAFNGSIQIFHYLILNGSKIDEYIWPYAIHGNNAEIIQYLEDNHIEPYNKLYIKCLKESIKCHHNDMAKYFENNYSLNDNLNRYLKFYNFDLIQYNDIMKQESFAYLCKYDYYIPVGVLVCDPDFDVNCQIISIKLNIFIQLKIEMFQLYS